MKYILLLLVVSGCSCSVGVNSQPASSVHFQCMAMCETNRQSPLADKFYRIVKATENYCYAQCNNSFAERAASERDDYEK